MIVDTSREAVERRAAWHENEAGAWRADGGNIALARIHDDHAATLRALLAERDAARALLTAAWEAGRDAGVAWHKAEEAEWRRFVSPCSLTEPHTKAAEAIAALRPPPDLEATLSRETKG